jgi:hypothetical protein
MQSTFAKVVCRLLAVLMIWTPYQIAQAGMIGTEQVVQSTQSDRSTVLNFVNRGEVASQLQAFGINPSTANDRVAALTDEEARFLAGQIQSQPAGGVEGWVVILLILLIAAGIWWAWKR